MELHFCGLDSNSIWRLGRFVAPSHTLSRRVNSRSCRPDSCVSPRRFKCRCFKIKMSSSAQNIPEAILRHRSASALVPKLLAAALLVLAMLSKRDLVAQLHETLAVT